MFKLMLPFVLSYFADHSDEAAEQLAKHLNLPVGPVLMVAGVLAGGVEVADVIRKERPDLSTEEGLELLEVVIRTALDEHSDDLPAVRRLSEEESDEFAHAVASLIVLSIKMEQLQGAVEVDAAAKETHRKMRQAISEALVAAKEEPKELDARPRRRRVGDRVARLKERLRARKG
jgi:hypothetical protein